MTRACEDLAKLRRSGILDEDALEEAELPIPARVREPSLVRGSRDDIPEFARWKQSRSGEDGESSAHAERTDHERDDSESCSSAAAQACGTGIDGSPAAVHADRPGSGENTDNQPDAPPEESLCPGQRDRAGVGQAFPPEVTLESLTYDTEDSAAPLPPEAAVQPPNQTARFPRSTFPGTAGHLNALLLVVCVGWFAGNGHWSALHGSQSSSSFRSRIEPTAAKATSDPRSIHEHRTMNSGPLPQNKANEICAGRGGSDDCMTITAPAANTCGVSGQTGERRAVRGEPAARNKAMAIGSDCTESSGQMGSALTSKKGHSALLIVQRFALSPGAFPDTSRASLPGTTNEERPRNCARVTCRTSRLSLGERRH